MSQPERTEIRMIEVPAMYGTREIPVEVIVNKGRVPKAERTLTRRQRRLLSHEATGRADSLRAEGMKVPVDPKVEKILFERSPHI